MNARTDVAPVNWNALKKFSKVFVTILLSLVLGLAAGEPVRAEEDYTSISAAGMAATIALGASSYYVGDNTNILDVPIYASFTAYGGTNAFRYFSGIAYYSITNSYFTFDISNNTVNVKKQYFIPSEVNGFSCLWLDSASLRLYFNNFTFNGSGTAYYILLGYMRYEFDSVPTGFQLNFTRTTNSLTPSVCNVRATDYEYGFMSAVVDGIDNSSAIQQIYQDLLAMKNANSTFYLQVTNALNRIESDIESVDQWSHDIYQLLYDYIYPRQDPAAQASSAANVAESMAAEQVAQEQALMSMAPGNMEELDAAAPLGILDDVSNSTRFWGTLVQEFSTGAGALWGVFIFALLVGLITFILRLR